MSPSALKVNLPYLKEHAVIIVNDDAFTPERIKNAEFDSNPLKGKFLSRHRVLKINISSLIQKALEGTGLSNRQIERNKNFFVLGLVSKLFQIHKKSVYPWIERKFQTKTDLVEIGKRAFEAGYKYCDEHEKFGLNIVVKKSNKKPGKYKNLNGNSAISLGLLVAAKKSNRKLFLGGYPITPSLDILHDLSRYKDASVKVFQAEDEIAAIGAALGASYAGALASTATSGPGMALKGEFINLAVMAELPLVVINVQRGGPSTGLPTKSEQADLLQALYGRHGESPLVVIAADSPSNCFASVLEAAHYAIKYMTPVILLTDGNLAQGSEPLRIPDLSELPDIVPPWKNKPPKHGDVYCPYVRDGHTLARPWVIPGTPGYEHCIGGLEKEDITGMVSDDPLNHERMVKIRNEKIQKVAKEYAPLEVYGDDKAEILIIGWGSPCGVIRQAVENLTSRGIPVACLHVRNIHPFPSEMKEVLFRYNKVLVVENNLGQLNDKLRAEYLIDTESLTKVQGRQFKVHEIEHKIKQLMGI
jgi:2-oxoglutarate ferredoxin oxidoreductase subunit alpha